MWYYKLKPWQYLAILAGILTLGIAFLNKYLALAYAILMAIMIAILNRS